MLNNAERLLQEAAEALKRKEYAKAEVLQRQGYELLREEGVDESRLAAELEKLADIHLYHGVDGSLKRTGAVDSQLSTVDLLRAGGEVVQVLLEGLVVLFLDLQFGLELLDEELEAGDFGAQLVDVAAARGASSCRGCRNRGTGRRGRGLPRREGFR